MRQKPDLPQRLVGFPERPFRLGSAEMINRELDTPDERLERLDQLRSRLSEAVPDRVALFAVELKSGWRSHKDITAVIAMCLLTTSATIVIYSKILINLARPRGVEPLTPRSVVWCSIQLSYGRVPNSSSLVGGNNYSPGALTSKADHRMGAHGRRSGSPVIFGAGKIWHDLPIVYLDRDWG